MKLTIKKGDNVFLDDIQLYNSSYSSAVGAVEKLKQVINAENEKQELARIAREEYLNAEQSYKEARQTLQSAGRVVEEYKSRLKTMHEQNAERRRVEAELNSAYRYFYESYNSEKDNYNTFKHCRATLLDQRERNVQDESVILSARANVKTAFNRLYEISKMIEIKYGLDLNSKDILALVHYGDENAAFDKLEKIEVKVIDSYVSQM